MEKNEQIIMNLLSLSYSRYVSRANTIVSSWINSITGVTLGFFGIVFSYSQVYGLKPDSFKLSLLILISLILAGVITFIAFFFWYDSRFQRKVIVEKIKSLNGKLQTY